MPLVVYVLDCVFCHKSIEVTAVDWEPVIVGWKLIKRVKPTRQHLRSHLGWCESCAAKFGVEEPTCQLTGK